MRQLLFALTLFGATLLAYAPALRAGFIWNDSDYVTAPALRSLDGLARIWFELGATEQYYPVLHSAFWLQHRLWGDAAGGYHLLNVLLHATAALMLAAVLRRLFASHAAGERVACLAAFLFALHPVGVESVAWISEEKNTLSLVFYLAAALAYLRFDAERGPRAYVVATVLFALALLSKSTTATLPPALLVALWWRRGRLDWRRDVGPLLPWFALGAAMGLFSAYVERRYIGAEGAEFELTLLERTLLAGRVVWFYLGKLLWPADLIFIYPRWRIEAGSIAAWLPLAGVGLALAGLWRLRGRGRAPLAAALFFGGSLFPVLGFFNVYAFMFSFVADHWQYLPSLGVIVLLAGAWQWNEGRGRASGGARTVVAGERPARRSGPIYAAVLVVAALGVLTFHQSRMYADMRTFYRTTVARNPAAWMAHNNLGNLLREDGDLAGAVRHFEAALRVRPDLVKAHNNLGVALRDLRRPAEAMVHFQRALELMPGYPEAHNHLGALLREAGRTPEAIAHLLEALRLDPQYHDARNHLGMALRDAGRMTEAIAQFERVIRVRPDDAPAHLNMALTLSLVGRDAEAMEQYRIARRLNPAIPELPAR